MQTLRGNTMKQYPEPHTSPWFEYLMLNSPIQAYHTMGIISACNGDTNICSVCGDKPTKDVIERNMDFSPQIAEYPFRLCDDCIEIRKEHFNATFREPEPGEITNHRKGRYA